MDNGKTMTVGSNGWGRHVGRHVRLGAKKLFLWFFVSNREEQLQNCFSREDREFE